MRMTRMKSKDIIYAELSYLINGFSYKVHNQLGCYKNEKQYADALEHILQENNNSYKREFALPKSFKGEGLRRNIPDFIIEERIILDCKAKRLITKEDYYQMQRYLTSYNKKLGIIINFRQKSLHPKRIINSNFK